MLLGNHNYYKVLPHSTSSELESGERVMKEDTCSLLFAGEESLVRPRENIPLEKRVWKLHSLGTRTLNDVIVRILKRFNTFRESFGLIAC